MRKFLNHFTTLLIVFTAIFCAASAVTSHVAPPAVMNAASSLEAQEPEFVPGWEEAFQIGTRVRGDGANGAAIVAFMDLQCPVCASFHTELKAVTEGRPDINVYYVHYPLSYHRWARPAARASECVLTEGREAFAAFVDHVLSGQDSLGKKTFSDLAKEAGIRRWELVESCVSSTTVDGRIDRGLLLGKRLGVRGTPSVIVNGFKLASTPSANLLLNLVDSMATNGR